MKTNEILTALMNLNAQRYIIVPVNQTTQICRAAQAVGMCALCGAYDADTQTRVIYLDTVN